MSLLAISAGRCAPNGSVIGTNFLLSFSRARRQQRSVTFLSLVAALSIASTTLPGLCLQAQDLSSSILRDPGAVKVLSQALSLAGGKSGWKLIHGVRVDGTMTIITRTPSGSAPLTESIKWVDDWSTGKARYIRATTTAAGTNTLRHGDSGAATTAMKGKRMAVRPFDLTTTLLTHLPAAALALILESDRYNLRLDPGSSSAIDTAVVVSKADGSVAQQWFFSKTSGQLNAVRFTVPDPLRPTHLPTELIVYKHFQAYGSLTVPDDVVLVRPTGESIKLHFDHMENNPSVSTSDFVHGGQK